MRVSDLSQTRVGARLQSWRVGVALLGAVVVWGSWGSAALYAQQWRARATTRVQYVEAQTLALDSVEVGMTTGSGTTQRQYNGILVTCATGADYCYYYRSDAKISTVPVWLDLDLNVFGFGIEGLRFHANTRFRGALGTSEEKFWPRTEDDHFDVFAAYLELNRPSYRVRLGRDYQTSGLGWYGYDGISALWRYRPVRLELEAYGGWGLERGLPERVTSSALESLGSFQPLNDNYLFGFRGSARPLQGLSLEAIYQREIETDRSGISSERVGFEAAYVTPNRRLRLDGHADYDLAAGWWGKAGAKVGWTPNDLLYLEGRYLRYRPFFSLQTIWVAFSPVAYTGYGLALGIRPGYNLNIRLDAEIRSYGDTGAEVSFYETSDDSWRTGIWASWRPLADWNFQGAYWLNWGFGSAISAGDLRADYHPMPNLSVGARFSAFVQQWELRVGEGQTWSIGLDSRWRTRVGTLYAGIERYQNDRKDDAAAIDWTQWRAVFGLSYYLGSEPGRTR